MRAALGMCAFAGAIALAVLLISLKTKPKTRDLPPDVVTVQTFRAESLQLPRVWTGYGTTRALNRAEVAAEISGRVVEKPEGVEAGALVSAGDVLLRVDPEPYANQVDWHERTIDQISSEIGTLGLQETRLEERLELVESDVGIRERDYRRVADALEQGAANTLEVENKLTAVNTLKRERAQIQEQLDTVVTRRAGLEARLAGERAMLGNARLDLERTTVRSPISGRVVAIAARVGDRLDVGAPVAVVVDQSRVEVPLRLPVSAAGAVSIGDTATVEGEPAGVARWTGQIQRLSPEADPETRTITVYAVVTQDPEASGPLLLPGVFVAAGVRSSRTEPVVVVPRSAVMGDVVFVMGADFRVHRRAVEVLFTAPAEQVPGERRGEMAGEWAAIGSGLDPGEVVVISNLADLADGSEVRTAGTSGGPGTASSAGGTPVVPEGGS